MLENVCFVPGADATFHPIAIYRNHGSSVPFQPVASLWVPNQSGKSTSLSRHTGSALAFTRFSQAEEASVGRPVKTLQLWASTTSVARWRETLKLGPDVSPLSE